MPIETETTLTREVTTPVESDCSLSDHSRGADPMEVEMQFRLYMFVNLYCPESCLLMLSKHDQEDHHECNDCATANADC